MAKAPSLRIFLILVALRLAAEIAPPIRARSRNLAPEPVRAAFPVGKPVQIPAPLGLPPVPIPEDNPPTAETIALGRKLFFDPILSRDHTISCASCHPPDSGMADPERYSKGVGNKRGNRQSMSVLNAAYNFTQFWDGRAQSLEEQAARPVPDAVEMAHSLVGVERRLAAHPEYVDLFARAWGPGRITFEMAAKSIASYERTLISGNSPFDRYYFGGNKKAMSPAAIRGLELFLDITLDGPNCVSCHRIEKTYATFIETRFHNTGVAWDPPAKRFLDLGRFAVTGEAKDEGSFKVPTLRNIALTAPYMHDGSLKTLDETVDFYFNGGRPNHRLSGVVPHKGVPSIPKDKQPQARADLVEFMRALTGDMPKNAQPPAKGQAR